MRGGKRRINCRRDQLLEQRDPHDGEVLIEGEGGAIP